MSFTEQDVRHVAQLARLGLSADEQLRLGGELSAILDAISKLQQVNTSDISETAQVGELTNVWRDDEQRPPIGARAALRNAPASDGVYFTVGAIQESDDDR
ncbi:MAG TPA: Asp-tRNA(Asn)/Glu-tRNA(Gln) amidotransferase subunit GatC [Candidatus Dormibacteraeota bacterium]|nr:Asp-tRNA(Asn)/Glu-tRNA(Gln) amidotransferase subunit GatC [Candidatus Dormibacteraeota bacterium]